MSARRGFTLVEILIALAVIGIFVSIALPEVQRSTRRAAVRAASSELRTIFNLARARAVAYNRNCGIKFSEVGKIWVFAVYDDGDGDGVRNDDITKKIDRIVGAPRVVLPESRMVTIGVLPETIRDPDGDKLTATSSPVVFGKSTICSFSALGSSSPGTIYITDKRDSIYAVRVFGTTAKVRVLRYDRGTKRWVS